MSTPNGTDTPDDGPGLRDVIEPHETPHPDHREHAKASPHVDDDELERRTRHERDEVAADRRRDGS